LGRITDARPLRNDVATGHAHERQLGLQAVTNSKQPNYRERGRGYDPPLPQRRESRADRERFAQLRCYGMAYFSRLYMLR
jgi:hypothetical protein